MFVIARAKENDCTQVLQNDPFVLIQVNDAGIERPIARLVLNQPPSENDALFFRVINALDDTAMNALCVIGKIGENLATKLKCYLVVIPEEVAILNSDAIGQAIKVLESIQVDEDSRNAH